MAQFSSRPFTLTFTLAVAASAVAATKTPAEMITENNYPSIVYAVKTEDGYYLRLDRIPNPGKPPVFLGNPIFSAGSIYLHMGPNYSLGYLLHDAGFDVFLGSDRGTVYSQDFTSTYSSTVSPKSDSYFLFSWHEHATKDNPAFIRKILEVTKQTKLSYVGFSMSSCELLAMLSDMPEYNNVIRSAHLMAPVITLGETRSRLYQTLHLTHNATALVVDTLGVHKVPANQVQDIARSVCPSASAGALCNSIIYFLFDSPRKVDYVGNAPDIPSTWPSGGSLRDLLHYAQNTRYPGRFKHYDFGSAKNLLAYGSSSPPDYQLENVEVPTFLYRGDGDPLVSDADMAVMTSRMPGFVEVWMPPVTGFGHADFVWDRKAVVLYRKVIQDLNRYL